MCEKEEKISNLNQLDPSQWKPFQESQTHPSHDPTVPYTSRRWMVQLGDKSQWKDDCHVRPQKQCKKVRGSTLKVLYMWSWSGPLWTFWCWRFVFWRVRSYAGVPYPTRTPRWCVSGHFSGLEAFNYSFYSSMVLCFDTGSVASTCTYLSDWLIGCLAVIAVWYWWTAPGQCHPS